MTSSDLSPSAPILDDQVDIPPAAEGIDFPALLLPREFSIDRKCVCDRLREAETRNHTLLSFYLLQDQFELHLSANVGAMKNWVQQTSPACCAAVVATAWNSLHYDDAPKNLENEAAGGDECVSSMAMATTLSTNPEYFPEVKAVKKVVLSQADAIAILEEILQEKVLLAQNRVQGALARAKSEMNTLAVELSSTTVAEVMSPTPSLLPIAFEDINVKVLEVKVLKHITDVLQKTLAGKNKQESEMSSEELWQVIKTVTFQLPCGTLDSPLATAIEKIRLDSNTQNDLPEDLYLHQDECFRILRKAWKIYDAEQHDVEAERIPKGLSEETDEVEEVEVREGEFLTAVMSNSSSRSTSPAVALGCEGTLTPLENPLPKLRKGFMEWFHTLAGLHKLRREKPSTAFFGNWGITKAIQRLNMRYPNSKLQVSLVMSRAQTTSKRKAEITLSKQDSDSEAGQQWAQFTQLYTQATSMGGVFIYHLRNHYSVIYAVRTWSSLVKADTETELSPRPAEPIDPLSTCEVGFTVHAEESLSERQTTDHIYHQEILIARRGQRPSEWVPWTEVRQTLLKTPNYQILAISRPVHGPTPNQGSTKVD